MPIGFKPEGIFDKLLFDGKRLSKSRDGHLDSTRTAWARCDIKKPCASEWVSINRHGVILYPTLPILNEPFQGLIYHQARDGAEGSGHNISDFETAILERALGKIIPRMPVEQRAKRLSTFPTDR